MFFKSENYNDGGDNVTVDLFHALEGDTDGDGDIDIFDFNQVVTHFDPLGNTPGNDWTKGNFDGDVDINDFDQIVRNFSPTGYGVSNALTASTVIVPLQLRRSDGLPDVPDAPTQREVDEPTAAQVPVARYTRP